MYTNDSAQLPMPFVPKACKLALKKVRRKKIRFGCHRLQWSYSATFMVCSKRPANQTVLGLLIPHQSQTQLELLLG